MQLLSSPLTKRSVGTLNLWPPVSIRPETRVRILKKSGLIQQEWDWNAV
jgi:hypothetical protein